MDAERRTFALDSARLGLDGIVMSLMQSGFLIIAIRYFSVNDLAKSVLAASPHLGQLAALFVPAAIVGLRMRPSSVAAVGTFVAAAFLLAGALVASGVAYVACVAGGLLFFDVRLPFLTSIHEQNYPAARRGRRFGFGALLTVVVALGFDLLFGRMMDESLDLYRPLLGAAAAAVAAEGFLVLRMPSRPAREEHRNPFRNLGLLAGDPVFGKMILSYFILGFANLWTQALRVVYITEADRGLGLSPFLVVVIAGVVPQLTRLVFNRVWSRLFDRLNLVVSRIIMSIFMGVGIFVYFLTPLVPVIVLGSVLINIGFAGAPIIWHLWVTRIAPPGRSHTYMSIHVFFTGVRGTLGPAIGFGALAALPFAAMGAISLGLVLVSSAIIFPMRGDDRVQAPTPMV